MVDVGLYLKVLRGSLIIRIFVRVQGGRFSRTAVYMEYMRIAENYPTPKSDKKAIIRGVSKIFSTQFGIGYNRYTSKFGTLIATCSEN